MNKNSRFYGKNQGLIVLLKSFLTAYALCVTFHAPLIFTQYETGLDYAIASIYELLGVYDIKFIFLWVVCAFFYGFWARHQDAMKLRQNASFLLSALFALCLLLGESYHEAADSSYCFGSGVNFLKFSLAFAGYAILFHALTGLCGSALASHDFTGKGEHFFTRHAFSKSFFIILGSYVPFLLLAFPGNLCWDAIGQIEQVIGDAAYSTHHPLFHTLVMGGMVKGGQLLFHSGEIGLFGYMLLQDAALAAALAATIAVLAKRSAKPSLLFCLLLLYCLTPVYSNMASTAVKDVPFSASVIGYVIFYALYLEQPELLTKRRFVLPFFLIQICVILLRNNGIYVILLSGIGAFCFLFRQYRPRQRILCLFASFGGSILTAKLLLGVLVLTCHASPGSAGEMMSVPFQQTARYLQLYQEELSPKERDAIEKVLGDAGTVAAKYDPYSADLVKALFRKESTSKELADYMKAWFSGFLKHPGSYFEAFFAHVYGWFTPSVSNSIRYETDGYDAIRQGGLFPNAEKLLIFYYRFAGRFTPLAVFENIGACVWALFFLFFYQKRQGQNAAAQALLPLWVSLLICMAAPCFLNHPRYAFPILFTLPFLYGFTLTIAPERE